MMLNLFIRGGKNYKLGDIFSPLHTKAIILYKNIEGKRR